MLGWVAPFEVTLELWDREYGDIVFGYGGGDDFIVSDRFVKAYDDAGLTGLCGFEEVTVARAIMRGKPRRRPVVKPQYWHVRVAPSRTAIDPQRSSVAWHTPPTCSDCMLGRGFKGCGRVVIDEKTWRGEDIVIPRGLRCYVVSERFADTCVEQDLRNANLTPATLYEDASPHEYPERALQLMTRPLSDTVLQRTGEGGELIRYIRTTNEMIVAATDGAILEYLKPVDGIEYWRNR